MGNPFIQHRTLESVFVSKANADKLASKLKKQGAKGVRVVPIREGRYRYAVRSTLF